MKRYMVKRMGIREENRTRKMSNTKREKRDRGEKDRALDGKRQKERKEGKIYAMRMKNGEKLVGWLIEESGRYKEKKESEKEEMGRKR